MYLVCSLTGGVERCCTFDNFKEAKAEYRRRIRETLSDGSRLCQEVEDAHVGGADLEHLAIIMVAEISADSEEAALAALRAGDYKMLLEYKYAI